MIFCSILIGCKPPEEVILEPEIPVWTNHPDIQLDRRLQIQAHATDDRLWLMGNNYLLSLDSDHRLSSDELVAPIGNDLWNRSFLSGDLFATELYRNYAFDLRLNEDPSIKTRVDLRELNCDVQEINGSFCSPMAINNQGQVLVGGWVNAGRSPAVTGLPLFLLQPTLTNDSLSVKLERQFWVNQGFVNVAGSNIINGMYAVGDTFYFSNTNMRFYQLPPNQEPELLFQMSQVSMLEVRDTLLAIGYLEDLSLGWYFRRRSENTWNPRNFQPLDNGFMRFAVIQDRIIAYRRSQIWELLPNSDHTSLTIKELNTLGLEQLIIHDMTEFKGRVYLCTERGLYYQPLSDFFIDKSPE